MWIEKLEGEVTRYVKELPEQSRQIHIGTLDRRQVVFINFLFNGGAPSLYQYSFRGGKPLGYASVVQGFDENGGGFPEEVPGYSNGLMCYFHELGKQIPSMKKSIDDCIGVLETKSAEAKVQ